MQPLDVYSASYLLFMGVMVVTVRNHRALLWALFAIACEWAACQTIHGIFNRNSVLFADVWADAITVYAFAYWVPYTKQSHRALLCFKAMVLLHFMQAINLFLVSSYGVAPLWTQFAYLSVWNALGYLAMLCIAGGVLREQLGVLYRSAHRNAGRGFGYHLPRTFIRDARDKANPEMPETKKRR